jgi:hypothetical protein
MTWVNNLAGWHELWVNNLGGWHEKGVLKVTSVCRVRDFILHPQDQKADKKTPDHGCFCPQINIFNIILNKR